MDRYVEIIGSVQPQFSKNSEPWNYAILKTAWMGLKIDSIAKVFPILEAVNHMDW